MYFKILAHDEDDIDPGKDRSRIRKYSDDVIDSILINNPDVIADKVQMSVTENQRALEMPAITIDKAHIDPEALESFYRGFNSTPTELDTIHARIVSSMNKKNYENVFKKINTLIEKYNTPQEYPKIIVLFEDFQQRVSEILPSGRSTTSAVRPVYRVTKILLQSDPRCGEVMYENIRAYAKTLAIGGEHEKAISVFRCLRGVDPTDFRNEFNLANCYFITRNDARADYYYHKALQKAIHPQDRNKIIDTQWRFYKGIQKHELAEQLMKNAEDNNDLIVVLQLLDCFLDIDVSTLTCSLHEYTDPVLQELDDFYANKGNDLIPYAHLFDFHGLKRSEYIDETNPSLQGIMDPDVPMTETYERHMTPLQRHYVRLHEIAHFVYSQLSKQEHDRWAKISRKFSLQMPYLDRDNCDPVEEAFCDFYAAFIIFRVLWQEQLSPEYSLQTKNDLIHEYFTDLFISARKNGAQLTFLTTNKIQGFYQPEDAASFDGSITRDMSLDEILTQRGNI